MDDQILVLASEDAIRRYISMRPHASDTAEGIHSFWIGMGPCIEITEQALAQLTEEGVLEKVIVGARIIWRKKQK